MKPNLLIIGAAKSGTTSLYEYLSQHPDIFFPPVKEPRFLTLASGITEFNGPGDKRYIQRHAIKDFKEYQRLFDSKNSKIIGEASPDILYYYDETIPTIKNLIGNPKIIIILREPAERAFSAYMHLVREMREEKSFSEGLDLEKERISAGYEFMWHYKSVGLYYEQVKSFIESFSHVHVLLSENLRAEPDNALNNICDFLQIDKFKLSGRPKRVNVSGRPKNALIQKFISQDNILKEIASKLVPYKQRERVRNWIQDRNLKDKEHLDSESENHLSNFFTSDLSNLQSLLKVDIGHWITSKHKK